jgi:DNA helicase II / ATP-dependent DNA helicase PcrA
VRRQRGLLASVTILPMDILSRLNPQQRAAVEHGAGPALVLAGAGSGKTRTIAYRIAYLIQNSAARPQNILAVTFTNKAAKEMRERIQSLLGPSRTSEPLISTFHSFCVRLLRREIHLLGYRRDFSIYDTDDQKRLMKQILKESGAAPTRLPVREILSRISYAKNHRVPAAEYSSRFSSLDAVEVENIYASYDTRLRQLQALDFDDLLLKTVEVLEKSPDSRAYYSDWYRYILVDEYQDTNRPQYELLRLLTIKHQNLFVVGDEDQSIYKFRGADIQNILRFEKDFPGARIFRLEQNYRSTQSILHVASSLAQHNIERKGKTLWTENEAGDDPICQRTASPHAEAAWVCSRIEEIGAEDPCCRSAILYRANFLSRNFEEILLENGIPYAVVGSVAFFGRMEIKDLLAYLRIIYNPDDDVALLRILNTPPRGIGSATVELLIRTALDKKVSLSQTLRDLVRDPQLAIRSYRALQRFQEALAGWQARRDSASLSDLLGSIVQETEYRKMLEREETTEDAANRMANIEELIRAAAESAERGETVFEFLDRAALSSELDRLDPDARVSLMTLHSAKGLEFDVVFLVGLEEGLLPHSQSINTKEDLEEERRLCYVGITRARRKLFLTWARFRRNYGPEGGMESLPSRFLAEMSPDLIEGSPDDDQQEESQEDEDDVLEPKEDRRRPGRWRQSVKSFEVPMIQPKSIAELRAYLQRVQQPAKGIAEASGAEASVRTGMRVRHERFGDGIVLSRERIGNDVKLTVTFSRAGRKILIERYARLKVL